MNVLKCRMSLSGFLGYSILKKRFWKDICKEKMSMKALITGATSGIGRDMAVILAKQGIDLIIASRDTKKMQALARRLPVNVKTITVDLSKESDCYYLYNEVKGENIDILINNAGFGAFGYSWEVSLETELNMIDLNIRAVHILTKLFLWDSLTGQSMLDCYEYTFATE